MQAGWEVMWVAKGKTVRRDYGTDFAEALRIYTLAVEAGKKALTLRCKNQAIEPPAKLRPREVVVRREARTVVPMRKVNASGIWWCPYCGKLRRFVKKRGYVVEGIRVEDPIMACPMCGISHRDGHVRRWNPIAEKITARVKDPNRKRRRRRREEDDE